MAKDLSKNYMTRDMAMKSRPVQTPALRQKELDNGGLRVTLLFKRNKWQKWLGAPAEYQRSYDLDELGREVYEVCTGDKQVKEIIRTFGRSHSMSAAEAEMAVTSYLRTLVSKGLVAMAVSRG
jgi:hypothetical protein